MSNDEFNTRLLGIVQNALPHVPPERVVGSAMLFTDLGLTSVGLVTLAAEFESVFDQVLPVESIALAWTCTLEEWMRQTYRFCYMADEAAP